MSEFTQFKDYSKVAGTYKTYVLNKDLCWDIGSKNSDWNLIVLTGRTFDISVPRWLEWIQNPHDKAVLLAAAVHDELLRLGHDQAFASVEFRRAAIAGGTRWFKAWLLFFSTLVWTAF
jgi:hypothetical protein